MGFFNTNLKVILSSLAVAVVLFWSVSSGISKGKQMAQAQTVVATANSLSAGLQYFYSDQDRFPTALEFSDPSLMLNYFSSFPPPDFISTACSQSYIYKRISTSNFNLSFCLPVAYGNYNSGWNGINEQK